VVLDNLEQLVAVAPDLVRLLEDCPALRLVVTSRRPLRVAGEQEWPLVPLPVPRPDATSSAIAASPAVRLFVERARAVAPDFTLAADNAADVVALCHRLDGLPLAIELAAARVRLFPPAALLRRLGDRLDLLVGGGDRPERHRTLRATIDWSVRLLDPVEEALFARLSVFRGGGTLAAIEAVCDLDGTGAVAEAVAGLLDHGLLVVADDRDDDEPRVRMLATVQVEAAARLAAAGETTELRRRHLAWFAAFADTAQPFLCGPAQVRWMARVDPERDNLRAAAATAIELEASATLLEMAWDLYVHYHLRGALDEAADWVRAALTAPDALDRRQRAIGTTALAIHALTRGEVDGVAERLEEALAVFRADGLVFETAVAEMHLGICALAAGAWSEAARIERDAIAAFASVGHDWGVGTSENLQGLAEAAAGDLTAARACYARALERGRAIGNAQITAEALVLRAATDLDRSCPGPARDALAEAVPFLEASRDVVGAAGALEVAGALALAEDDPGRARLALVRAGELRDRLGVPPPRPLVARIDRLGRRAAQAAGTRPGHLSGGEAPDGAVPSEPFALLRDLVGGA
jgi:predicted ATPase